MLTNLNTLSASDPHSVSTLPACVAHAADSVFLQPRSIADHAEGIAGGRVP